MTPLVRSGILMYLVGILTIVPSGLPRCLSHCLVWTLENIRNQLLLCAEFCGNLGGQKQIYPCFDASYAKLCDRLL